MHSRGYLTRRKRVSKLTACRVRLLYIDADIFSDSLHANRLINIEERPFQRISKALLGKGSTVRHAVTHYPSPPPEDDGVATEDIPTAGQLESFREHILLDFAALESSIIRIQLVHTSNERERQRFAAEKAKIMHTAQAVRENTLELRTRLAEAQRILQLRKGYDEIAGRILDDQKLKSRDETRTEIEKLEGEIEDLQQESAEFEGTWASRREQFDKLTAESQAMLRLIKGIKDDPEDADKDEDMEDEEGDEGGKAHASRADSEGPDRRTPRSGEQGDSTPIPEHDEAAESAPINRFLEVDDSTRAGSRATSPLSKVADTEGDVDMTDTVMSTLDATAPTTSANLPNTSHNGDDMLDD
ncbi:uncharacterized protein K489DRAFT_323240 [Dissoconium aciculare CBS 342.82]|uniref:Tho complex subunit 7/Mft1p n=1 Tax=Dissoconium aciculare CBS 342.82 TaxID=1314786 RepID=A0A6J3M1L4_9PEZI|nr:uncharacterized protein K489DRAFT_323240 [Dissoconium aciculare CBS 342.82]KAF1820807.1 hypothetical protein K489DRAFT_323240 [Dissoconium aciculare CBS 342.82]